MTLPTLALKYLVFHTRFPQCSFIGYRNRSRQKKSKSYFLLYLKHEFTFLIMFIDFIDGTKKCTFWWRFGTEGNV